jgi:predicted ATP-grasp superfamily ATP-dependent carboligase
VNAPVGDWTLFASAGPTAAFVARHHDELAAQFRLTTPWSSFRWAYDKRLTYSLTAGLGVPYPGVHPDQRQRAGATPAFPAILNPRPGHDSTARAPRRGRCATARATARYDEGAAGGPALMIRSVPGAGGQLSVAAVPERGPAGRHGRRTGPQYPMDFGQSIPTSRRPGMPGCGAPYRVLAKLRLDGLVEIQFKRNHRDGLCKLLDINLRVWGWHTIGTRIGRLRVPGGWPTASRWRRSPRHLACDGSG